MQPYAPQSLHLPQTQNHKPQSSYHLIYRFGFIFLLAFLGWPGALIEDDATHRRGFGVQGFRPALASRGQAFSLSPEKKGFGVKGLG